MRAHPLKIEAINSHKTRYFTGIPCKYGHIAERSVANNACIVCSSLETKRRRATPLGIIRHAVSASKTRARSPGYMPIDLTTVHSYPVDNLCELCGRLPKSKRLHADHEHYTGQFRGWICYRCNSVLGNMEQIGPGRISEYIQGLEYEFHSSE